MKPISLPAIETGIPLPPVRKKDERSTPKSPWPAFLRRLEPGWSFVVPYPTAMHVMSMGKYMGIHLTKQDLETRAASGMMNARVWLVDIDIDYSI